nr:sulfotransferase [Seongchinamella sediminis]
MLKRSLRARPASNQRNFTVPSCHRKYYEKNRLIACEQTPRYLFATREILRAYPDARIINMTRDPRDVLLSQRSKWKRRFLGGSSIPVGEAIRAWCNYHPWLVSRLWKSCVEYADAIDDRRFMSLRFEDLLAKPEREIKKICRFIGIEFESNMLKVPQMGSSSGDDSPNKKGIDTGRAEVWRIRRIRRSERLLCEWICKDQMANLNYVDYLNDGRFSPSLILPLMILPVKVVLALPLNVRRFPKLAHSLKRRFYD